MKYVYFFLLTAALTFSLPSQAKKMAATPTTFYIVATDYVKADGKTDVTATLQKLIDDNPNRTIYFPDGTYLLSHSLLTPADPTKAVHLVFANFAVVKASSEWKEDGGALIRLGGKHPYNSIYINGSNYGIEGGIFDGSEVADGISIDSGRETRINHVSIKHVKVGIHIKKGANNGSSDADIVDVNIVGNNQKNSIGVLIEGWDNTFTNMRIASVNVGVWCKTAGNSFKNIHPLYIFSPTQDYPSSCGFIVEQGNNWLDYCYSDQFATGFKLGKGICANLTDCFAFWYSGKVPFQTAIECIEGSKLESYVYGLHIGFSGDCSKITILKADKGGKGTLLNIQAPNRQYSEEDVSEAYIVNVK